MKKAFLRFGHHAPKITSRRLGVLPFVTAAFKSDGGNDDDDDEDDARERKALLKQIRKQFAQQLEEGKFQDEEDVKNLIGEQMKAFEGLDLPTLKLLTDKEKGVMSILKAQGEAIAALKEQAQNAGVDATLSRRSQIKAWQDENKETLEKLKSGIQVELKPLTVKVPATIMTSTHFGGASSTVAYYAAQGAQIVDALRAQPTFWDLLPKGRTNLAAFPWVNKTNHEGNAAFVAEGALKPLLDFELVPGISTPKKVAAREKASTEVLFDIDAMETLIEQDLRYAVEIAVNTAVLTGVASATSPAGITTIASLYNLTTIKTPTPNNYDALRAAIAQLTMLRFNRQVVAVINPIDAANMDLAKATNSGVYMLPPFTTADGRRIGNVPVIEDAGIPVGSILVGDLSAYRILIYQDFFIAWGWENDDFSRNLVTAIGEMRFHQFMNDNNAGAFIFDTFANIKTALTPA